MKIRNIELTAPMRLAPMADISNIPFRVIAKECGSAMTTSEEIDAIALTRGSERTVRTAAYLPQEKPLAMQLLGEDPNILSEAAKTLQSWGADIVDLNMGCPVPKVVKKGQGAALMRDPRRAAEVFRAMRKVLQVPFTIKIRGGWDNEHLNAVEIAKIAEGEGVDAITVHPRTRSQRFTGKAPWEIIRDVVGAVRIPVTGNGDVKSQEDARSMMAQTGVNSVMIGRGALGKPWIFNSQFDSWSAKDQLEYKTRIILRHKELMHEHTYNKHLDFQIKKHLVWYSAGLPHAANLRHRIFTSNNAQDAWKIFNDHWQQYAGSKNLYPIAAIS